jgi:hypothetical protein
VVRVDRVPEGLTTGAAQGADCAPVFADFAWVFGRPTNRIEIGQYYCHNSLRSARPKIHRHCERSEAIQFFLCGFWIASSLRSSQ